ncbi:unnamed protein product [Protopolystoma xenopodis]|uniref:Uncharacterized protein n=1 Tax=Protopolystoma xenopodis TaxID=117903 RepID=A0A3S5B1F6_9PLAT|nr:unnamed protein product [Protopolystoma xenopodis]
MTVGTSRCCQAQALSPTDLEARPPLEICSGGSAPTPTYSSDGNFAQVYAPPLNAYDSGTPALRSGPRQSVALTPAAPVSSTCSGSPSRGCSSVRAGRRSSLSEYAHLPSNVPSVGIPSYHITQLSTSQCKQAIRGLIPSEDDYLPDASRPAVSWLNSNLLVANLSGVSRFQDC